MSEPLGEAWFEVGYLLTAIETHQAMTKTPGEFDRLLYWQAEQTRGRMGDE
jgi:hypothetical protein